MLEAAGFGIDGGGSFDALIQWSPFPLDVAFAAWARITAGGTMLIAVSLSLDVTGPQPSAHHRPGLATGADV